MAEKKKGGATKNKVNSGDILRSVMKSEDILRISCKANEI